MMAVTIRIFYRLGGPSLNNIRTSYSDTPSNLKISNVTKEICYWFIGKQETFHSKKATEYGIKVVGGVQSHTNLPLFYSVKESKPAIGADAIVIRVPPLGAATETKN
jgi:succinyl-CoA synthetase alpha subunit